MNETYLEIYRQTNTQIAFTKQTLQPSYMIIKNSLTIEIAFPGSLYQFILNTKSAFVSYQKLIWSNSYHMGNVTCMNVFKNDTLTNKIVLYIYLFSILKTSIIKS